VRIFSRVDFWRASALLAGSILGVGIFGVPFVFAQSGIALGAVLLLFLAAVVVLLHLMYGEVIERTGEKHRLIGYVTVYFGNRARLLSTASVVLGGFGALVAYILVAQAFLNELFGPLFSEPLAWGLVFWVATALGVFAGVRSVARTEIILTIFLVLLFATIIVRGVPLVSAENLTSVHWGGVLAPYGVVLFALVGISAVPEVRAAIRDNDRVFGPALVLGTLVPAVVTLLFALVVVGVAGGGTSPEAIAGLVPVLGSWVVRVGAVVGLLAITTSFLMFGLNLADTFVYDWRVGRQISNVLTVGVPLVLLMAGITDFIGVIGIAGALFGAIDGTLIVLIFLRAKKRGKHRPHFSLHIPVALAGAIIAALIGGGIYQFLTTFL
jgi:tyrosine-specific transport protein